MGGDLHHDERMDTMKYKYSDFKYKRHLTLEEAEAFCKSWNCQNENEYRYSRIEYKKKSNDYTVVYGRNYN